MQMTPESVKIRKARLHTWKNADCLQFQIESLSLHLFSVEYYIFTCIVYKGQVLALPQGKLQGVGETNELPEAQRRANK
jgi:hypothetical protein